MGEKNIMKELINFGFTANEITVYEKLLQFEQASATTLAKEAGVANSKIYNLLARLKEKGLVFEVEGEKRLYQAKDPAEGFQGLQEEYRQKGLLLEQLKSLGRELFQAKGVQQSERVVKVVTSKTAIVSTFNQLFLDAREGGVGFIKGPYLMDLDQVAHQPSAIEESIKNGLHYRAIYEVGDEQQEKVQQIASHFQAKGEEVRLHDELPMKMVIIDREKAFIALDSPGSSGTLAILVNHPVFSQVLQETFERYWEQSSEI